MTPTASTGPLGGAAGLGAGGGGGAGGTSGAAPSAAAGAGGTDPGATGAAGAPGATAGSPTTSEATGTADVPGASGGASGAGATGGTETGAGGNASAQTTGETTTETGNTSAADTSTEISNTSTTDQEPTTSSDENTNVTEEFSLTAPWSAGEDCTPMAKDACDDIPVENRATMIGGQNEMPTITWTAGPEGTQSYAVVYQDLSNGFAHWALWDIPADVHSVGPGDIPAQTSQSALVGQAWFGSGACDNVYQLSVYALSEATLTPSGGQAHSAVRDQLDNDDGTLVLASDFARVTPKPPCGQ